MRLNKIFSPTRSVSLRVSNVATLIFACGLAFSITAPSAFAQLDGIRLNGLTNQSRSQFRPLPLDQAFPFYISEKEAGHYTVVWEVAQDHYLYDHGFNFSLRQSATSTPLPISYSLNPGIHKHDEFFGDVEVYYLQVTVDLSLPEKFSDGAVLLIEFQGCADWGFCYPPQEVPFKLM